MANIGIALESKGAKKNIYLEYAADIFKQTVHEFEEAQHPLAQILKHGEPYAPICEESEYGLAQTYLKMPNDLQAEKVLAGMLKKYQKANITRGYYLSRAWYELGRICMNRSEYLLL